MFKLWDMKQINETNFFYLFRLFYLLLVHFKTSQTYAWRFKVLTKNTLASIEYYLHLDKADKVKL